MSPLRFAAVGVAALLAACSAGDDCTQAGCLDGVTVIAPADVTGSTTGLLTVCVGGDCQELAFETPRNGPPQQVVEFEGAEAGASATATLVMPDGRRYSASASLRELRPNGEACGPECAHTSLLLASE